ncbi:monocarboxylate transporter 13-like [Amphiura filiformis]|uniref:monocarboxylate transporter 13-like n=1 Tax=Amphiura filiformis TaxID=82378 RepID=UPI003B212220
MKPNDEFTVRSVMTLLAVFVVTFFQLGSMKAYGVLVPQLSEHLSLDLWQVGLTGSIWIGLRALLGPLWALLARTFSYRILTVLGGIISAVGILCAAFSHTFTQLICSMALLGIGHGLPLVAKVVALRDYFKDNFSLANGIAFAGGAVGMIIFAPLMEFGIRTYGWRGAMYFWSIQLKHQCCGLSYD